MSIVRTDLRETRESASELRFSPTGNVTQTNVQKAIEQVSQTAATPSPTTVNVGNSPYAVLNTDALLYVDSSGGAVQILLQAAASRTGGALVVKDTGGHANTNNITLTPSGAETIDGLAPDVIDVNYGGRRLNPRSGIGYTVSP